MAQEKRQGKGKIGLRVKTGEAIPEAALKHAAEAFKAKLVDEYFGEEKGQFISFQYQIQEQR